MFKKLTSKEALFTLRNGDSRTWWFNHGNGFFVIDYLPDNFPELETFCFPKREDGLERVREMVDGEGWEVVDGEIPL
jgi:hypothetical protein